MAGISSSKSWVAPNTYNFVLLFRKGNYRRVNVILFDPIHLKMYRPNQFTSFILTFLIQNFYKLDQYFENQYNL